MSLVVGAVCSDGVVILADWLTWHDDYRRPKWEERKVRLHGPTAWACFGRLDVLVHHVLPSLPPESLQEGERAIRRAGQILRDVNADMFPNDPQKQSRLLVGLPGKAGNLFSVSAEGEVERVQDYAILGNPESWSVTNLAMKTIHSSGQSIRSVARTVHAAMVRIEEDVLDPMVGLRGKLPLAYATGDDGHFSELGADWFAQ